MNVFFGDLPINDDSYFYSLGDFELKEVEVGQRVSDLRQLLDVSYPMQNGIIRDWEDMERLWDHTFGDEILSVATQEAKILLTEAPMNPLKNRERLVEVMFEKYGFQGNLQNK